MAMPAYQTGNVLVLNAVEKQSGSVLCANSESSADCDLLRLDADGSLQTKQLSATGLSLGAPNAGAGSALLSLVASAHLVDIICISSPGRSDCNVFRLTAAGELIVSGRVVADGGFASEQGDMALAGGAITTGGALSTGSLRVGGVSELLGAVTAPLLTTSSLVATNVSASSLSASSLLADDAYLNSVTARNAVVTVLTANATDLAQLTVRDALVVSGASALQALRVDGSLFAGLGVECAGDISAASLNASGPIQAGSLLADSADLGSVLVRGSLDAGAGSFASASAGALTVTGEATLQRVTALGLLDARGGLTSGLDILTTGAGRIATTGSGQMTSAGLLVGLAGISSPAFLSTTDGAPIASSGSLSAASLAVEGAISGGSLKVGGLLEARGPVELGDLNVTGALRVEGDCTLRGVAVTGGLSLGAGTHLSLGSLSATSASIASLEVGLELSVRCPALLQSLTALSLNVTESLEVGGQSSLNGLSIRGPLVANASVTSLGPLSVLGSAQVSGNLTAGEDMRVGGTVSSNFLALRSSLSTSEGQTRSRRRDALPRTSAPLSFSS